MLLITNFLYINHITDEKGGSKMVLNNFATIGKAVLHQVSGLQKNYKEVYEESTQELNEIETGCYSCPTYREKEIYHHFPDSEEYQNCLGQCSNCPFKKYSVKYVQTVKYNNEANRFGYAPRLKKIPLLLFLMYHFHTIDKNGIIIDVDVKYLSEFLRCTERSIHAANEKLVEYGYISVSNGSIPNKLINVQLKNYKSYFLTAKEGGRGYYICSINTLKDLINAVTINIIRLVVRQLLEDDDNSVKASYDGTIEKTYQELRRALPDYCKPNVIRKAFEGCKTKDSEIKIFDIAEEGTNKVIFTINQEHQAKKNKISYLRENEIQLTKAINNINDVINEAPEQLQETYPQFYNPEMTDYPPITLKDTEMKDLVSMTVQYTLWHVLDALADVYTEYILNKIQITNLGGLIRSKIIKHINTTNNSYQAA